MVEFILIFPLLMLMLLAIVEFALLAHDVLLVHLACYHGARAAAIGKPIQEVRDVVLERAPKGARPDDVRVEYLARKTNSNGQEEGGWQDASDPNNWRPVHTVAGVGKNDSPAGSIIRVRFEQFPHRLVTGNFFGWLPNYEAKWEVQLENGKTEHVPVFLIAVQASQPRM
jgi:hypothetical protein